MKKVLAMVLALILVLSVAACAQTESAKATSEQAESNAETSGQVAEATEGDKKYKVAYLTWAFDIPYWTLVSQGMEARCKELGYEFTAVGSENDAGKQLSAMENLIAQKYDVIILSAVDEAAVPEIVKTATDQGIVVIGHASYFKGATGYSGPTEQEMGGALGLSAGEWVKENLSGKVKGVTFFPFPSETNVEREKAIRDSFEAVYPDIEWIGSYASMTIEEGQSNFEAIYQAHPDVQVILSGCDDGIIGAYEVAKSNGLDLSKMIFGGVNAIDQVLDIMKEESDLGTGAYRVTVDNQAYENGYNDIDFATQIIENLDSGEFDDRFIQPAKAVTWKNINEYR